MFFWFRKDRLSWRCWQTRTFGICILCIVSYSIEVTVGLLAKRQIMLTSKWTRKEKERSTTRTQKTFSLIDLLLWMQEIPWQLVVLKKFDNIANSNCRAFFQAFRVCDWMQRCSDETYLSAMSWFNFWRFSTFSESDFYWETSISQPLSLASLDTVSVKLFLDFLSPMQFSHTSMGLGDLGAGIQPAPRPWDRTPLALHFVQ